MSQWITHDGKGCPDFSTKTRGSIVVCQRRDGFIYHTDDPFGYDEWEHAEPGDHKYEMYRQWDIIAYQVIEPYKGKQDATE